ncbi:DUF4145 domain-containing protein [Vibrio profundum]|uniref:DUF4145 domain-containing protein n=1 Tax=Vibrio profundum TaxID=2910247 RepID=UPI003D0E7D21
MSETEKVVLRTHRVESLLRSQYHAEGEGLEQLISSCEERLPHDVIAKLHQIAQLHNTLTSDEQTPSDAKQDFLLLCRECEKELTPRSSRFIWRTAIVLMMLITMAALGFYYAHWDELHQHLRP